MRIRTLMAVALAWLASALTGARGETKMVIDQRSPEEIGKILRAALKAARPDPEPTLRVRLSYPGGLFECRAPGPCEAEVESGPKGATIQVPTYGLGAGSANLAFENCAPPMRFTVALTGAQSSELSQLTLTSGPLTLALDEVGVTRAFDAKGRPRQREEGAAYTVRATRSASGEVELHVRRGPGAALGKVVRVGWRHRSSP